MSKQLELFPLNIICLHQLVSAYYSLHKYSAIHHNIMYGDSMESILILLPDVFTTSEHVHVAM